MLELEAYRDKVILVKIGGSTLGSGDTTLEDLVRLQGSGVLPVVVHGGGRAITEWLDRHGLETRFMQGLRVTDMATLNVVTAVLAGLVNKGLVAALQGLGGRALGLTGVDGGLLVARRLDADLGYVGEVVRVDLGPLKAIMGAGYMPVIAPLGVDGAATLNINADTVAGELALALAAKRLILLTDVEGVCDAKGRRLERLNAFKARELIASGVISGGMLPKLEACLRALSVVPRADIIDGRSPHALLAALSEEGQGTRIEL